jgi:hypothetical protein
MEAKQFLLPEKAAQPSEEDWTLEKENGVIPLWGVICVLSLLVQCTVFAWKGQTVTVEHVLGATTGHVVITLLGVAVPLWYNKDSQAEPLIIGSIWAIVTVSLIIAGLVTE